MVAFTRRRRFGPSRDLYLLIGAFMIYMMARLFINFLFWEQTAAFGDGGASAALRESKELARCASRCAATGTPALSWRHLGVGLACSFSWCST